MLRVRRAPPTDKSKSTLSMGSGSRNLVTDSITIVKHNACRRTQFTSEPKTSALVQPKVFFFEVFLLEILTATSPTTRDNISPNI
ncbi:hypothetical protein BpHYR1_053156 [Brachionus plicatilis]|uniref:Uncharacterized protein n=1 Tax=Brachionus plicatilis TaxID=10195 RepID=A0A3M7QB96_BRAPC|nr:hypothetical protein BpHYR1_053156 [Brachionus plicatilis]